MLTLYNKHFRVGGHTFLSMKCRMDMRCPRKLQPGVKYVRLRLKKSFPVIKNVSAFEFSTDGESNSQRICAQTPWQGGWFERKRVLKADQKFWELQLSGHDRREKGSCISFQFARNIDVMLQ